MSSIKIYTTLDNDNFLRKPSLEVDLNDISLKSMIYILTKYCKENKLNSLAINQLGILKRIIYLNTKEEEIILINPTIIKKEGLILNYEDCLSCNNYIGLVERPYKIEVNYYDINKKEQTRVFKDIIAAYLDHEIDHLNGIMHIDKAFKLFEIKTSKIHEQLKKDPIYQVLLNDKDYEELIKNTSKTLKK